jgi:hypothetical protein
MRRVIQAALTATLVVAVTALVIAQSTDAWIGIWRLNVAKSTYSPANLAPKSQTITQTAVPGGGFRAVVEGVDAEGRMTRTDVTTMFDGKPSEVKGAPDANTTRVYRRIDARTYEYVQSVAGKVTTTVRTVVAADGKTRTITTTGTNAQGQTVKNVALYERQ